MGNKSKLTTMVYRRATPDSNGLNSNNVRRETWRQSLNKFRNNDSNVPKIFTIEKPKI